jgi:hypothetical protein
MESDRCFSKAATQKCRKAFLHSEAAHRVKYMDVLNAHWRSSGG